MTDYVLKHHGIKGQKWGVRRFQNPDGTLIKSGQNRKNSSRSDNVNIEKYKGKKMKEALASNTVSRGKASVSGSLSKVSKRKGKSLDTTKLTAEASRKTKRQAKKDAEEYARAKMYYGEGAGNRRKLIKAKVEQRKKNDPDYAEEFEKQLANQDMEKHAKKAKQERKARDATAKLNKNTKKVVKFADKYGRYMVR